MIVERNRNDILMLVIQFYYFESAPMTILRIFHFELILVILV